MNPFQCTTANRVLALCDYALFELDQEPHGKAFLFRWFGTLAALRAVNHAIIADRNDPGCRPEMREAIDEQWAALKAQKGQHPHIFHDFIERDRNRALKEFAFNAEQGFERNPLGYCRYYVITEGPFLGHDPRAVVRQAIEWLRGYVHQIALTAAAKAISKL